MGKQIAYEIELLRCVKYRKHTVRHDKDRMEYTWKRWNKQEGQ